MKTDPYFAAYGHRKSRLEINRMEQNVDSPTLLHITDKGKSYMSAKHKLRIALYLSFPVVFLIAMAIISSLGKQ